MVTHQTCSNAIARLAKTTMHGKAGLGMALISKHRIASCNMTGIFFAWHTAGHLCWCQQKHWIAALRAADGVDAMA
jgi:hypothetical protein